MESSEQYLHQWPGIFSEEYQHRLEGAHNISTREKEFRLWNVDLEICDRENGSRPRCAQHNLWGQRRWPWPRLHVQGQLVGTKPFGLTTSRSWPSDVLSFRRLSRDSFYF